MQEQLHENINKWIDLMTENLADDIAVVVVVYTRDRSKTNDDPEWSCKFTSIRQWCTYYDIHMMSWYMQQFASN